RRCWSWDDGYRSDARPPTPHQVRRERRPRGVQGADAMTAQDVTAQPATTGVTGVVLTAHAAAKVKALLEQEGRTDLALRVAVQPGGCSGLRSQLSFDG